MDHYNIPEYPGDFSGAFPVAATTTIPDGGIVAIDSAGHAVAAASTVTGYAVGRAFGGSDNSAGLAGATTVKVKRGIFGLALDATHPPGITNIGQRVFMTAPDTVATQGTCRGGILVGFDPSGLAIVDFKAARALPPTLASTNGTMGAAGTVAALAAEGENIGDDVRSIAAWL